MFGDMRSCLDSCYESEKKSIKGCMKYCQDMIDCDNNEIKSYLEVIKYYKKAAKEYPERKSYYMKEIKKCEDRIRDTENSTKNQKARLAEWQEKYKQCCAEARKFSAKNIELKVVRGGIYKPREINNTILTPLGNAWLQKERKETDNRNND